jgi:hypothetical protein
MAISAASDPLVLPRTAPPPAISHALIALEGVPRLQQRPFPLGLMQDAEDPSATPTLSGSNYSGGASIECTHCSACEGTGFLTLDDLFVLDARGDLGIL